LRLETTYLGHDAYYRLRWTRIHVERHEHVRILGTDLLANRTTQKGIHGTLNCLERERRPRTQSGWIRLLELPAGNEPHGILHALHGWTTGRSGHGCCHESVGLFIP